MKMDKAWIKLIKKPHNPTYSSKTSFLSYIFVPLPLLK
jgi:hypothetical protein